MDPGKKYHGIKLPAGSHTSKIKNTPALFDVYLNFGKVHNGPVVNLTCDVSLLIEFFRYLALKSKSDISNELRIDENIPSKQINLNPEDNPLFSLFENTSLLTSREVDIMEKLSKGLINKEIADSLGLTLNTVKNHLKNIYPKLHVGNRNEAIAEYLRIKNQSKN